MGKVIAQGLENLRVVQAVDVLQTVNRYCAIP